MLARPARDASGDATGDASREPRRDGQAAEDLGYVLGGGSAAPAIAPRAARECAGATIFDDGTYESAATFGPGSTVRLVGAVEGARGDFFVGFYANGVTFLIFQAAAALGAGMLGCRTGRGTEEEAAYRATVPLPEGEHEYAIGWGAREVVWRLDGKVVCRHRARYAGPPHRAAVRAANGTRVRANVFEVDGMAVGSVERR